MNRDYYQLLYTQNTMRKADFNLADLYRNV